ncbi:MAG: hypothetical protein P4L75_03050 [Clostridia bacterium]|nr:hypothetical protein [Clostridia bacterium]
MLIYQAVIMLLVIGIVFVLAFVIRMKNRSVLALIIIALVVAGSFSLSLIQSYFGVYYLAQKCDTSYYSKLRMTPAQKDRLGTILTGYKNITSTQDQYRAAYEKTYSITDGGVNSSIKVDFEIYKKASDANEYFKVRQLFYENKLFLPSYPEKTMIKKKKSTDNYQYITSYIRSNYPNYNDPMYFPSKLYYVSEVIIQDNDMIIDLYERTNKPVTEKNQVLEQLADQITKAA